MRKAPGDREDDDLKVLRQLTSDIDILKKLKEEQLMRILQLIRVSRARKGER